MTRVQLFIDNGGYSVKALYLPASANTSSRSAVTHASALTSSSTHGEVAATATTLAPAPKVLVVPNCVGAAVYAGTGIMGDQLDHLPHYHGLMVRRPVDRGFVVDGGLQARVWEHVLQHFSIESEEEVDVWLTVPFAAPKAVAQLLWLLCTRSFRFGSVTVVSSSFMSLIAYNFARGASAPSSAARKRPRSTVDTDAQELFGCSGSSATGGGMAVMVDVGFSATTVIPYVNYIPVHSSVVRLDVGGKVLTNRLKEYISFSQMNVMEDTWLINHVKEQCCVVARHPRRSLQRYAALWKGRTRDDVEAAVGTVSTQRREGGGGDGQSPRCQRPGAPAVGVLTSPDVPIRYYLPTIPALLPLGVPEAELPSRLPKTSGVDAAALQHLLLCQERFLIPELLFTPADVGINQQGVAQAITEGIFQRGLLQHLTKLLRPLLLHNVCVYGGTASQPNFRDRLEAEVAAVAPQPPACDTDLDWKDSKRSTTSSSSSSRHGAAEAGSDRATCLSATPALPEFLLKAGGASTDLSLQPLLGAWCLLTATASDVADIAATADSGSNGGASQRELLRLRALVHQRSGIELQRPPAGRVTVETFQHALERML
ncbi:putative actin-like protein [Leishmania mexicana MHOM/GT/2001/U1103]|uniref:Actin-like protein n=1 Tax=Leishmania mexicana (strain MHOM/GT/2001/U1103) TaxID=929439 RepID=E9AUZ0_LEIMU|nr:putative actin-like protein [Leishmania mexicana MHOM/GT/2001/U1103]CBZ26771.1 putative actin-like protein [Leishmania mexicana MHOM/GT/2001/U1103]